ncbi:MAG: hypothetical protein AB7F43_08670 [Bacteriovoracia bacterium]
MSELVRIWVCKEPKKSWSADVINVFNVFGVSYILSKGIPDSDSSDVILCGPKVAKKISFLRANEKGYKDCVVLCVPQGSGKRGLDSLKSTSQISPVVALENDYNGALACVQMLAVKRRDDKLLSKVLAYKKELRDTVLRKKLKNI